MQTERLCLARAYHLAKWFCSAGPPRALTIDDVASGALEGLWIADETFDEETGGSWLVWSKQRAWDAMQSLVRRFRHGPPDERIGELDRPLGRTGRVGRTLGDTISHGHSPGTRVLWRDELRNALMRLTENQRKIVFVRAAGFTSSETGAILGKQPQTVEATTSQLRNAYDREHPLDPRTHVSARRRGLHTKRPGPQKKTPAQLAVTRAALRRTRAVMAAARDWS